MKVTTAEPERPGRDARASVLRDRWGLLPFAIYSAISFLIFGRQLLGHFHDFHIGGGGDPFVFMWYLVWWPFALVSRLNPFVTFFMFAPVGINLTWATCIPLPSLLLWPATAAVGPVASFNIMMLLAPPLAAWSAFVLCRALCKSWWPSLLGGYVFGFSAYIGHEMLSGNPHTTLVFIAPLAVLLVVRAIEGELAARRVTALLAGILAAQFLISIEVFATMTMFGAISLALAWCFEPSGTRRRIVNAAYSIACAYAAAIVIISPYLYWLFAFGSPHGEIWPFLLEHFNLGNLIFIIPSGQPLTIVALAYAWRERRSPAARTLLGTLIAVAILMGAPRFHFGAASILTPAGLLMRLPVINKALPFRFAAYAYLIFAIIVSRWLGSNGFKPAVNTVIGIIVVAASFASLRGRWVFPAQSPAFFASDMYRDYIKPGDNLLILPFGYRGNSMLWQAETGMYFRMADGWVGAHPAEFDGWPIFNALYAAAYLPDARDQLGAFMAHHGVDDAVVADSDPAAKSWNALFSNFSAAPKHVGGVTVFRIVPASLAPYRNAAAFQMRRQAAAAAVETMLAAAGQWIAAGRNLARLTPYRALQLGALKPQWFVGSTADVYTGKTVAAAPGSKGFLYTGAWMGGTADGRAKVVIRGTYNDLAPVIGRYRKFAAHVYFPYPNDLLPPGAAIPPRNQPLYLEMDFDREQIAAIAAQLHSPVPQ
ncbi:MAG: hypothetical protein ACREQI_10505 [Candidatus Binataceae bacterium]